MYFLKTTTKHSIKKTTFNTSQDLTRALHTRVRSSERDTVWFCTACIGRGIFFTGGVTVLYMIRDVMYSTYTYVYAFPIPFPF